MGKYDERILLSLERIASTLDRIEEQKVPEPKVKVKEDVWKKRYKKMYIEKACDWLYQNLTINCEKGDSEVVEEFRKYMMNV